MFIFLTNFLSSQTCVKRCETIAMHFVQFDTEVKFVATEVAEFCSWRRNFCDNDVKFYALKQ